MTLQEIADIAARYDTGIAMETVRACAAKGYVTGTHVSIPPGMVTGAIMRIVAAYEIPEEEMPALIEKGAKPKPVKAPRRGLVH